MHNIITVQRDLLVGQPRCHVDKNRSSFERCSGDQTTNDSCSSSSDTRHRQNDGRHDDGTMITQDNEGMFFSLHGATLLSATWQPNGERPIPSSIITRPKLQSHPSPRTSDIYLTQSIHSTHTAHGSPVTLLPLHKLPMCHVAVGNDMATKRRTHNVASSDRHNYRTMA
ncbi:hypothetical protein K443DRAFT_9853 [Laccaria amethystina LaAM-08-1]|uniref:Uncharacterized protein n=1 Tax=Laccaria amethystina LaAM-08-1 TaxID=1095629 RepID=A0A0C9WXQ6_9AGAR|nr:hypothetical protein K443DRAFT_9853 [Laccaria amethystina LaAM-08-1]